MGWSSYWLLISARGHMMQDIFLPSFFSLCDCDPDVRALSCTSAAEDKSAGVLSHVYCVFAVCGSIERVAEAHKLNKSDLCNGRREPNCWGSALNSAVNRFVLACTWRETTSSSGEMMLHTASWTAKFHFVNWNPQMLALSPAFWYNTQPLTKLWSTWGYIHEVQRLKSPCCIMACAVNGFCKSASY